MTTADINEQYFGWLHHQVDFEYNRNNVVTFTQLLKMFHKKEFVWLVPNDDNRLMDAKDLRYIFLSETAIQADDARLFAEQPVSLLEVLIALSKRCAWNGGGEATYWAWKLIENLGLQKMRDPLTPKKRAQVNDALEALIWRTYNWDGTGGFFPLAFPPGDQTKLEIWYQMHAYIMENELP